MAERNRFGTKPTAAPSSTVMDLALIQSMIDEAIAGVSSGSTIINSPSFNPGITISDTSSPYIILHKSGGSFPKEWEIDITNNDLYITDKTAYVTSMVFQSGTGNIGINQTVPDEKLHVVGNIHVTGNIYASGEISAFAGSAPVDWWASMPSATDLITGGIKVGAGLTMTAGVLSASGGGGTMNHNALSYLDYATAGHTGFQAALSGTGLVYSNAGVISYDTSAYITTSALVGYWNASSHPTTISGYGIVDAPSISAGALAEQLAIFTSAGNLKGDAKVTFIESTNTFRIAGNIIATGEISAFAGSAPTDWWLSMPVATATIIGGIKVGAGLTMTAGVLSVTGGSGTSVHSSLSNLSYATAGHTGFQAALSGTGLVYSNAGTISYDTNAYITTAALAGYAPIASPTFTGTVTLGTGGMKFSNSAGYYNIRAGAAGAAISFGVNGGTWDRNLHLGFVDNTDMFGAYLSIINQTGNVGIGNIAPSKKLELSAANGAHDGLRVSYNGAAGEGLDLTYYNTGSTIISLDSCYNSDAAIMRFRMKTIGAPLTAMTILGNGRIGIGRTPTTYLFEVEGDSYTNGWLYNSGSRGWYNATYAGGVFMQNSTYVEVYGDKAFKMAKPVANGNGARLYLSNNQYSGNVGAGCDIIFGHYSDTADPRRYARIYSIGTQAAGTADKLIFSFSDDTEVPVMTLVQNGSYVGIGGNNTSPDAPLHVKGSESTMTSGWNRTLTLESTFPSIILNSNSTKWATIQYDYSSNFNIRLAATSSDTTTSGYVALSIVSSTGVATFSNIVSATNFSATSDSRLKQDIQDIKSLPITASYKQFRMNNDPRQLRYGIIAQELQKTHPELVYTGANGMLSVAYFDLLCKEVSDLKAEIKILKEGRAA